MLALCRTKPKLAKGHQHNSRVLFAEPTLCTRSSSPKPRSPGHTSQLTSYLSHMGRNIRGLSEFVVSSPWPLRDPKSRRLRHWPAFPLDFYVPRLRLYVHDFAFHCFGYPCRCLNHQEYCSLGFFIYYNLPEHLALLLTGNVISALIATVQCLLLALLSWDCCRHPGNVFFPLFHIPTRWPRPVLDCHA